MPLYDEFFKNAKWKGQDEFPSLPQWRDEVEKWLLFLKQNNQLERYRPRLINNLKQRGTFLAEVISGYFIAEKCGFEIVGWEPIYVGNYELEFEVLSEKKDLVLCEVKCPGWEREVIDSDGRNSSRLEKGKIVSGEVRSLSPWKDIRNSVAKGYRKFPNDKPSLLIIKDDMFSSPIKSLGQIDIALYCKKDDGYFGTQSYLSEDGCFNSKKFENLGGVLFLDVKITDTSYSVNYVSQLALNPYCLKECSLPKSLTKLSTLPIKTK